MIFIRLSGGLGNQLFQLTAALHLQAKTNMPISFYTNHLKNYETPREFMLQEILPKEFPLQFSKPNWLVQIILKYRINKALPFLFNWSITTKNIATLKPSKFYVLDDYFQDIAIFKNEVTIVANYINQAANNNEKVVDIYNTNNQFKNSVALHIRRGDFLNKRNANIFYIQDNSYYKNAIETMNSIQDAFIFSETEILDSKNITTLPIHSIIKLNLSDTEEFLLMTKFPNLIIANSTYSFWAAAATKNSNIVAPKNWFYNQKENTVWLNNLQILKYKTA